VLTKVLIIPIVILNQVKDLKKPDNQSIAKPLIRFFAELRMTNRLMDSIIKETTKMKSINRILTKMATLIAIVCFLVFTSGCASGPKLFPDTVEMAAEDALNRGFEGIIVCVNQPGETKLYAAGWDNRETQTPADPQALFKIASISKLYMAVAATKLVVAEFLSLDQTLAELMPELVGRIENADEITLRMLLQHRSGIPDILDHPDFPWDNLPIGNSETLELVLDEPAEFKPDRRYKYSNTNYLLLGEIMDRTLGYSHHQYIREEILLPQGLNHTYSLLSEVDADEVMSGYFKGWEPDVKLNDYTLPGGSMVATAEDVSIFLRALIDGSLLSQEEQTIYSAVYRYEHTGLLPGYQSIARYHEDIDAVVVQFVNNSGGNAWSKSESVYRRVVRALKQGN
jgi:D-alanyl-D-alanine carboxypeptidase